MLSFTVIIAVLLLAAGLYMAFRAYGSEKFQPGYELERDIGGYGATLGDKRSVTVQNFGIDDSIAGVFSARILTPSDSDAMRRRNRNIRMAQTADCDLVCRS
jgi:hypothetical protein